jgi:type IV pilus assembly protein PilY1
LWYAAKWGGFDDINGNNIPDLTSEWDRDGNDVPDTYFLVHNPLELENQLNKALGEILKRISAGTAVSVLSTSAGGEGSLYQAYFNPSVFDSGREVTWVGYLNALWVDQFGNLREDDGNQHLVLSADPIIEFDLDVDGDTIVRKYSDTDGNGTADALLGTYSLADLQPLWEGGEKLAKRTTPVRTIYTYIDGDGDGVVDGGEFGDDKFDANDSVDAAALKSYLGVATDAEAEDIIEYIRGEHKAGYRDRRLTVDGTPNTVWKLGDIVYSTPTVVGRPSENYHLVYGDTTYLKYVREHKDRQTVIFLGANDGMLHAFSAGTYHEGDDPSTDDGDPNTTTDVEKGWYSGDFGTELWAYIPYNLLPQLKWLMDPAYCHIYYVDLKTKVVDARIFSNDATHDNGWGTVLVGAMRLGGKELTCNSRTYRSAYFALDITNPANPDLLWEFSSSDLNYTTSYPAVFRVGTVKPYEPDAQKGDWYVIFGSGPTTFEGDGAATSHVYICNLANGNTVKTFDISEASGADPSFMASPITVDLGLDYEVDVAYIASSYYDTSQSRWEGKIYRLDIDEDTNPGNWTLSTFVTLDQPITIAPVAALDPFNRLWLYWGTGRFFSNLDKIDATVQRLYGVWDPGTGTIDASGVPSNLNNVTTIRVHEQGYMDLDGDGSYDDTTFKQYLADKRAQYGATTGTKYGWYLNITSPIAVDGERVINSPTVLGNIVLFPSFKPEEDICDFGGSSYLYALYYETGTAYQESVIGIGPNFIDVGGNKYENLKRKYLGAGMPTSVVVHAGREEGVKGMIQLGTGVVEVVDITPAESPQSKTIFWREKAE